MIWGDTISTIEKNNFSLSYLCLFLKEVFLIFFVFFNIIVFYYTGLVFHILKGGVVVP